MRSLRGVGKEPFTMRAPYILTFQCRSWTTKLMTWPEEMNNNEPVCVVNSASIPGPTPLAPPMGWIVWRKGVGRITDRTIRSPAGTKGNGGAPSEVIRDIRSMFLKTGCASSYRIHAAWQLEHTVAECGEMNSGSNFLWEARSCYPNTRLATGILIPDSDESPHLSPLSRNFSQNS